MESNGRTPRYGQYALDITPVSPSWDTVALEAASFVVELLHIEGAESEGRRSRLPVKGLYVR